MISASCEYPISGASTWGLDFNYLRKASLCKQLENFLSTTRSCFPLLFLWRNSGRIESVLNPLRAWCNFRIHLFRFLPSKWTRRWRTSGKFCTWDTLAWLLPYDWNVVYHRPVLSFKILSASLHHIFERVPFTAYLLHCTPSFPIVWTTVPRSYARYDFVRMHFYTR